MDNQDLIPFEGKEVRKVLHNGEWYFSVIDIIGFLTDSDAPSQYWHNMKKRDDQLSPICLKLKLMGQDGRAPNQESLPQSEDAKND